DRVEGDHGRGSGLRDREVCQLADRRRVPAGGGGAVVVRRVGVGGGGIGARDVEQGAGRGRCHDDGAGQVGSVGEGRERRPGDDASRGGAAVAGGDEGDAGRQRVLDYNCGGIRGPVVGDGDGVGDRADGDHGRRSGLGNGKVGDLADHGGDAAGRGGAVVVGGVGVDGGGIGA